MTLREHIHIKAAPERIWTLLADPAHWTRWNPKFVSIRRHRAGFVVPGEQFSMVSRMKRGDSPSEIMVREVMPLRRVKVHQVFSQKGRSRHLEVNLELSSSRDGIEVVQTQDHGETGIPYLYQLLIWFIHRFGKAVGARPLERLKVLTEGS